MTTLRRLLPAALAASTLSLAAATAAHATVDPTFGDPFPVSAENTTVAQASSKAVASTRGTVTAIFTDTVDGHLVVLERRLDVPTSTWSDPSVISDDGVNVSQGSQQIVADTDGNVTAVWTEDGTWRIMTATRLAGRTDWEPIDRLSPNGDSGGQATLEAGPNGTVIAAWASYHGGNAIRVRTRAANSASWSTDPVFVDENNDSPKSPKLDVNASGDAILLWDAVPNGLATHELRAARYRDSTDDGIDNKTWTVSPTPVAVFDGEADINFSDVALAPNGAATAIWSNQTNLVKTRSTSPGTMNWSDPQTLSAPAQDATADHDAIPAKVGILTQVVSDRAGNIVAAFQEMIPAEDFVTMYGTSRQITRTRNPSTGDWSPAEVLMGDRFGGAAVLTVDRNYDIAVSMASTDVLDLARLGDQVIPGVNIALAYRPDGASDFNGATTVTTTDFSIYGGVPGVTLDERGNPVVIWAEAHDGTARKLKVAIGDANGPDFGDISVPSSGTVDEPLTFSADASDPISGLESVSWSFGDGDTATGASVPHSYRTAGEYTVTIVAADAGGLQTSTTRSITITDAPVDEDEPKVLAPKVDPFPALLSGKKITLLARVTLRSGKKCSGKATATTTFGTTTYRTTVKLGTVEFPKSGKVCAATGTLKLKKTPSRRTKLRVTISSKSIKSRTVTTTRG